MGATPQRRGGWGCTSPSCPMLIEACRDGGSLPATAKERGSASALRWPWHNRKRASDIWNRKRVHRRRVFVVRPPPNRHVHSRIGIGSAENRLRIMAFRSNIDKLRDGGGTHRGRRGFRQDCTAPSLASGGDGFSPRNRVRVFPDPKTGIFQIEWRENGRRRTKSLKHRDWTHAKRQAGEAAAGFAVHEPKRQGGSRARHFPRSKPRRNSYPSPATHLQGVPRTGHLCLAAFTWWTISPSRLTSSP